jgi:hypothetical protein
VPVDACFREGTIGENRVYKGAVKIKIVPIDTFIVYNATGSEFGRLDPEMTQRLFAEAARAGLTPGALFLATIERGLETERRRKKWKLPQGIPPSAGNDPLAEIVSMTG